MTNGDIVSVAVDVQTFLGAILFFNCFNANIEYEVGVEKGYRVINQLKINDFKVIKDGVFRSAGLREALYEIAEGE